MDQYTNGQASTQSKSASRLVWFVWPRTIRRCLEAAEKLLLPDERIIHNVSGVHGSGTAVLCLTNHRVLVVDKKMFRFSYEDISYGAIREISYYQQMFAAEAVFHISGRSLSFLSYNKKELHTVVLFVQNQVQAIHTLRAKNDNTYDSYVDVSSPVLDPLAQQRLRVAANLKRKSSLYSRKNSRCWCWQLQPHVIRLKAL